MVYSSYDLYDHEYSERVRAGFRPASADPGGMLAPGQDEVELENSAMTYRDELLNRHSALFLRSEESPEEEDLRISFLDETARYMGLIPGMLFSVWGPTGPGKWESISQVLRSYERSAARESQRSSARDLATGSFHGGSGYPELIAEVSTIFGLLAEHFSTSAAEARVAEKV